MSEVLVSVPLRLEALAIRAGARRLRIQQTGMGPARSKAAAVRLTRDPAAALIVMGVCGGLDGECEPGDVVIAEELLDGELDGTGEHDIQGVGDVEGVHDARPTRIACPSAEPLAAAFQRRGMKVRRGPIVSVAHIARGETRVMLRERGAIVVDMESVWLAGAARQRPFAVIRVVADTPSREVTRPLLTLAGAARAALSLRRTAAMLEDLVHEHGIDALLGGG
jgi:nucleoside phosphorylase